MVLQTLAAWFGVSHTTYKDPVPNHSYPARGKSSVLNLPKAPLKLGGATVALFSDSLTEITNFSMSKLRRGSSQ